MNYRLCVASVTLLVFAIPSRAQDTPRGAVLQVLGTVAAGGVRALDEGFNNQVVKGKPFSATEERHSLQVLSNGTRIESSQTNRLFRDSEGRTRVEDMNSMVSIWDPVEGFRVELDPKTKTARRGGRGGAALTTPVITFAGDRVNGGARSGPAEVTENLKQQMINGVTAQGTRVTTTIPRGQIGNDREIAVVTERWVSNDLQMLVRSVNTDPRFGDTTYELTRIVQAPQDGYLFQIPSDYTEVGPGGRGGGRGRGNVPAEALPPGARGGARNGGPAPAPQRLLPEPSSN